LAVILGIEIIQNNKPYSST